MEMAVSKIFDIPSIFLIQFTRILTESSADRSFFDRFENLSSI